MSKYETESVKSIVDSGAHRYRHLTSRDGLSVLRGFATKHRRSQNVEIENLRAGTPLGGVSELANVDVMAFQWSAGLEAVQASSGGFMETTAQQLLPGDSQDASMESAKQSFASRPKDALLARLIVDDDAWSLLTRASSGGLIETATLEVEISSMREWLSLGFLVEAHLLDASELGVTTTEVGEQAIGDLSEMAD